jgi:phospholipase/carboxylesterase
VTATPPGVVVYLHGHDDRPDAAAVTGALPAGCHVVAPSGPVATPSGRAWFAADADGVPDPASLASALDALHHAVTAAAAEHGVDRGAVVLGGFSQGAAIALQYVLGRSSPAEGGAVLAGVFGIAGWVPDMDDLVSLDAASTRAARFLLCHGSDDEVTPPPLGRSVARALARFDQPVEWIERPVGHTVAPFVGDLTAWLAGDDPSQPSGTGRR